MSCCYDAGYRFRSSWGFIILLTVFYYEYHYTQFSDRILIKGREQPLTKRHRTKWKNYHQPSPFQSKIRTDRLHTPLEMQANDTDKETDINTFKNNWWRHWYKHFLRTMNYKQHTVATTLSSPWSRCMCDTEYAVCVFRSQSQKITYISICFKVCVCVCASRLPLLTPRTLWRVSISPCTVSLINVRKVSSYINIHNWGGKEAEGNMSIDGSITAPHTRTNTQSDTDKQTHSHTYTDTHRDTQKLTDTHI